MARWFQRLDKGLHHYENRPNRRVREWALRRAEQWIITRQEADGCWGGIQPPWVYSLLALYVRGYSLHHPILAQGLAGFDNWTIIEDDMRRLECCQSPVWDSCLALVALADAGLDADDEQMVAGAGWLLDQEVQVVGDWAEKRPHLAPGGWAFEFENSFYPDLDDTAEVALALRRHRPPRLRADAKGAGAGGGVDPGDAVLGRRLGRIRRRQLLVAGGRAAVLRLRRGHRSAVG